MKRPSVAIAAAMLLAFQLAGEHPAFAHGTHLAKGETPPYTPPERLPYRFVTPTGSDILVDFLRNPNIAANAGGLKGLSLVVPRLTNELNRKETETTFQLSQGIYSVFLI